MLKKIRNCACSPAIMHNSLSLCLSLRIQEYMFSGCFKETKLGSSDQEASPSAGKNTCVPTAISDGVDISEDPGCNLL